MLGLIKCESVFWRIFNIAGKVVGSGFLVVGLIVGSYSLPSLLSWDSTINVNGTPSAELSHKLVAVFLPYIVAVFGWFLIRAKPYYPERDKSDKSDTTSFHG